MKFLFNFSSIIFCALLFNLSVFAQETASHKAPDFSLPDLEDNTVSLKDFEGQFLVIHIATTWCPYCNAEAPYLEEISQKYKDKNVKVLIIDVKEPKLWVKDRLQDKFNFSFPILLDMDGKVAASFAPDDVVEGLAKDEIMLASNILIDTEGNIRFMSLLDSKNFDVKLVDLQQKLNELLISN